jgi:hypothetical protein
MVSFFSLRLCLKTFNRHCSSRLFLEFLPDGFEYLREDEQEAGNRIALEVGVEDLEDDESAHDEILDGVEELGPAVLDEDDLEDQVPEQEDRGAGDPGCVKAVGAGHDDCDDCAAEQLALHVEVVQEAQGLELVVLHPPVFQVVRGPTVEDAAAVEGEGQQEEEDDRARDNAGGGVGVLLVEEGEGHHGVDHEGQPAGQVQVGQQPQQQRRGLGVAQLPDREQRGLGAGSQGVQQPAVLDHLEDYAVDVDREEDHPEDQQQAPVQEDVVVVDEGRLRGRAGELVREGVEEGPGGDRLPLEEDALLGLLEGAGHEGHEEQLEGRDVGDGVVAQHVGDHSHQHGQDPAGHPQAAGHPVPGRKLGAVAARHVAVVDLVVLDPRGRGEHVSLDCDHRLEVD